MKLTDDELVTMLHHELVASESSPTNRAAVPRELIWLAKRAIERLSQRVAVLEAEKAMRGDV
jgi:hypothetical protein